MALTSSVFAILYWIITLLVRLLSLVVIIQVILTYFMSPFHPVRQFIDRLVEPMLRWAADGTCVLLTVELDSPSPDEPPRVTVRGARPLSEVTSAARMLV